MKVSFWRIVPVVILMICGKVSAETNFVITGFQGGHITWTNVDPSLYYSIQWKPSLTGSNDWSESYRMLQDIQSSNDYVSVPIPMFLRVAGRSNQTHTLSLNADTSFLPEGYYDAVSLEDIDTDLSAANIPAGTIIFGIEGEMVPFGGNATPADVMFGKTFYGLNQSNWVLQVGTYGELTCDPGYYDLNGRVEDGCEFWLDPNGIYVSASDGIDDASAGFGPWGTESGYHPCQTITYGLYRAEATSRTTIYVAAGFYNESISLVDGISLQGGYNPVYWSRVPGAYLASTLTGYDPNLHKKTISGQDISQPLTVDGFTLKGLDADQPGGNSYIVWLRNNSATVTFRNNVFFAGSGANGVRGADGSDGVDGQDGSPGLDSVSPASVRSGGSGGILSCGATVVSGGNGGGNTTSPSYDSQASAQNGSVGQGPAGGIGGSGGYDGRNESGSCYLPASGAFDGTPGGAGLDGGGGTHGVGAFDSDGFIAGGEWISAVGSSGQSGQPGSGGGGGGAGGGAEDGGAGSVAGPTGGGGGSGGCAGAGGSGGAGGGGSFCIFVHHDGPTTTAPAIVANVFYLGTSGTGGSGGNAGLGGDGGSGGAAGAASILCSGNAGAGGVGGAGGPGGGAGGGAGGMSCGILISGVTGVLEGDFLDPNTFLGGTAGTGGLGGYSVINPGSDGSAGVVRNVDVR